MNAFEENNECPFPGKICGIRGFEGFQAPAVGSAPSHNRLKINDSQRISLKK
jgi:hypothetical protein